MFVPVAGAGDRLGLKCDVTGDSVPTAMLPYCGRTLLAGLIRDLQVFGSVAVLATLAGCKKLRGGNVRGGKLRRTKVVDASW